jgi:hypothetical protein
VRVMARCAIHPLIQSEWSDPVEVEIETVSPPPDHPDGPGSGTAGDSITYTTTGARSFFDHPLEYQFDWGDGTLSLWITPDSDGYASATHKWKAGQYLVRARARCKTHPEAISDWSSVLSVTIN